MTQSSLYKFGTGIASNVDVVDDDSRELGNVDVGTFGSSVEITTPSDTYRLGDVGVHNTVATDISQALQSTQSDGVLVVANPNYSSTTSFSHNVSNSMPDNSVPEGITVMFQADPANTNTVTIDGIVLTPGDSLNLEITNTNVVTTGGTGQINVLYEG